jgi:hypothetical protein
MVIGRLKEKNQCEQEHGYCSVSIVPENIFSSLPTKPNPLHLLSCCLSRIEEKQENTEGWRTEERDIVRA